MEAKLDWGGLVEAPKGGVWPRWHQGRVLFVIRNGSIEFPQGDRRIWPWSGITSIGYLNIEPTQFTVNVEGPTSKDGVDCLCVTHFEVQLKSEIEWRILAASRHDGIYHTFQLITTEAAQEVFKDFEFKSLLLGDSSAKKVLHARIGDAVSHATPYTLRRFVLDSVASTSKELDDSIRMANAAEASAKSISRSGEIRAQLERTTRQQRYTAETEDLAHETQLKQKREFSEREKQRKDHDTRLYLAKNDHLQGLELSGRSQQQTLEFKKQEYQLRLDHVTELRKNLDGDLQFWLAFNHPDLWTKIQISDSESRREVAVALQQLMNAHAHDQGVTQTLKRVMAQLKLGLSSDRLEVADVSDLDVDVQRNDSDLPRAAASSDSDNLS
jgi:hypothetical protein